MVGMDELYTSAVAARLRLQQWYVKMVDAPIMQVVLVVKIHVVAQRLLHMVQSADHQESPVAEFQMRRRGDDSRAPTVALVDKFALCPDVQMVQGTQTSESLRTARVLYGAAHRRGAELWVDGFLGPCAQAHGQGSHGSPELGRRNAPLLKGTDDLHSHQ